MPRFRLFALCAVLICALTACHTISGVGEDVKSAGAAIEKAGSH
jgi:predicted small secreted protein